MTVERETHKDISKSTLKSLCDSLRSSITFFEPRKGQTSSICDVRTGNEHSSTILLFYLDRLCSPPNGLRITKRLNRFASARDHTFLLCTQDHCA